MLDDMLKAVRQIEDPRSRAQLLAAVGAALSVLVVLVGVIWLLLSRLALTGSGWLDWIIELTGLAGATIAAWLLFPLVVSATLGIFADQLCDAVERRHYPGLPPPRHQPAGEAILEGLSFAGFAVLLNILVLPLYLLPGPNIVIYLALNGYLLGREYFSIVAARRHAAEEVADLRRRLRLQLWAAGLPIALALSVPILNLVAPLLGVSFMTHRYHRMTQPPSFDH